MKRSIFLFALSALLLSSCGTVNRYSDGMQYQDGIYYKAPKNPAVRIYSKEELAERARMKRQLPPDTLVVEQSYNTTTVVVVPSVVIGFGIGASLWWDPWWGPWYRPYDYWYRWGPYYDP